ncbi:MAG: type II toxin-antitoxin system VapC family toxin [Gemmatimonadetes bacterium]|jgi:PIN domain nuclease of toxin-antitoxin system|nr:type II toxin-antitoxin system VapC family toxin [Gemmatimonadota bacterium]
MIIVDTHVIIWDALQPESLSARAVETIARANETDGIIFCEISLWEIAMLIRKKRISVETNYLSFIHLVKASNRYIFRGISPEIADLSTQLPAEVNNDPADRLIAATAITAGVPLVTADENLRKAKSIQTIW